MSTLRAKTLSELYSDEQLSNAALCAKIHFLRAVIKDIGKVLGHNGDQETVLDAAKRVVREHGLTKDLVDQVSGELQEYKDGTHPDLLTRHA